MGAMPGKPPKTWSALLLHLALKHRPYFDEAHELGVLFWVILGLLSNQNDLTAMWFVFMTTTSSVTFFNPIAEKSESSVFVPFINASSQDSELSASQM